MLDGNRIAEFLESNKEYKMSMEKFYFLYRLMAQEQNITSGVLKYPGKKESDEAGIRFSQLSESYQQRFKTYLNSGIDWVTIAQELSEQGFLEIWSPEKNPIEIKLTEMRVTDKFKSFFLLSDIQKAYIEVLEIWPPWVWVNNVKFSSVDKSPDEMAKLYDQHVLKGGSAILHERFLMITKMFLEQRQIKGAPYKLSKWIIDIYENVAMALEQGDEPTLTSEEV